MVGPGTETIDAAGMTVTPGFIDAHNHPYGVGVRYLSETSLEGLRSVAEIKAALAEQAAKTPPDEWVLAFMYDDTKLDDGRPLTRKDIDEAVPNHPARVEHRGGHTGVYGSLAFERAGITIDTPDPTGGKYYREGGELTGKVAESGRMVIENLIPRKTSRERRREGLVLVGRMMAAQGLTSVHETGIDTDGLVAYQDAHAAGELSFRAYPFATGQPRVSGGDGLFKALKLAGIRTGFGDAWLRIGGVKFVADGSASERTMAMSTPYVGRPDDYGILTMTQDELHEVVDDAHRAGFQIGIHANGDRAIGMVLTAYERTQRSHPRPDPRFRLEHCSLVDADLIRRIAKIGAIPTPFYTYAHYHGNKWGEYGEEKMRSMFAHRSFLAAGIPVAAASDFPPGPFSPMMAIQSMVTRKDFAGRVWGENQCISVEDALRVCTVNAAYASFEEGLKGSIEVGKLADFVILERDPHEVDPDEIKGIRTVRTVAGGRTVFEG
jgi:predicted amidohydrolase YtcJ